MESCNPHTMSALHMHLKAVHLQCLYVFLFGEKVMHYS